MNIPLLVLIVVLLIVAIVYFKSIPEGYEDGFHYGRKDK
jgi:uncharacterized membrane protein